MRAPVVSPLMMHVCEEMRHCQAEILVLTQPDFHIQHDFFLSFHHSVTPHTKNRAISHIRSPMLSTALTR